MIQVYRDKLKSFQILSGTGLKMIACIAMFIDHLSKIVLSWFTSSVWFPMYQNGIMNWEQFHNLDNFIRFTLHGIGSVAFPLFCFLLSEGFYYTGNRKRYIGRMLLFAFISEIPFDIGFFHAYSKNVGSFPFYWEYQNVYFTLFLGLLCLLCIEKLQYNKENLIDKMKSHLLQLLSVVTIFFIAELVHCDYGGQGILFIVSFYLLRQKRICQIIAFLILYMITTGNQPTIYVFIFAALILFYNGKRGCLRTKNFFYWFYPVHIIILYLSTLLLQIVM